MKFLGTCSNAHAHLVDRPLVISDFFKRLNCADKYNQACQYELALEKKWDTWNPCFRLINTLIGLNTTDAWKLSLHHFLFLRLQGKHNVELSITANVFAGALTK